MNLATSHASSEAGRTDTYRGLGIPMRTPKSLRLPTLVLTAVLSGFLALGAADANGKKHKHHAKNHHAKKHHAKKHHAPPGPTLSDLQQLESAKYGQQVQNLTILETGRPQRGSPANGQPNGVWVYPRRVKYDTTSTLYDAKGKTYTETTHTRERDNVLRNSSGTFSLSFVGSSETCDPTPNACTASTGAGA